MRKQLIVAAIMMILTPSCGPDSPPPTEAVFDDPSLPSQPLELEPVQPCKENETYHFSGGSNGSGHGSYYHSTSDKCSDGIKVGVLFWTADEAQVYFAANSCPATHLPDKNLPKVDDRRGKVESGLATVRLFLETELETFKKLCGIEPDKGETLLDGFEDFYAGEMKSSWIHNYYIDKLHKKNLLGWGDEKSIKEAREAYAQTH